MSKVEELKTIDPFDVPLKTYHSLDSDEYWILMDLLHERYGKWVQEEFEETGAETLVICGGKIVFSSKDRYEPSDQEIEEIEDKLGKPCYVLTAEGVIEEGAPWSDLGRGNYYPTLPSSMKRPVGTSTGNRR